MVLASTVNLVFSQIKNSNLLNATPGPHNLRSKLVLRPEHRLEKKIKNIFLNNFPPLQVASKELPRNEGPSIPPTPSSIFFTCMLTLQILQVSVIVF